MSRPLQELGRHDVEYFRGLMSEVDRMELVTDELYTLDVQFISDDDKYFPFEVTMTRIRIMATMLIADSGVIQLIYSIISAIC